MTWLDMYLMEYIFHFQLDITRGFFYTTKNFCIEFAVFGIRPTAYLQQDNKSAGIFGISNLKVGTGPKTLFSLLFFSCASTSF